MSFTTDSVHLPPAVQGEGPVTLKYYDSQPERLPSDVGYTTVIAVHGVGFNSSIWQPSLPYLNERKIRLLSYNRRGYQGSSGLYLQPKATPGYVDTTAHYLLDLLGFMKFAVEELGIPKKDEKTNTGGIALLGWSKGTIPIIALLSLLPHVSKPLFPLPADIGTFYPMIESHLRSVLLYEPPGTAAGRPPTSDMAELKVDAAEIGRVFLNWVSKKVSPDVLPVITGSWEEGPVAHDFSWLLAEDAAGCEKVALQAFDPVPSLVGVGLILGSEASEYCLDVGNWIKARLANQPHTATHIIPGAGHFAMDTHPEAFADCLDELSRL